MGLLINKKQKHKHLGLTEKLDNKGARLEHTPRKSLKHLAQKTGVLKCSAIMVTQLLKLTPYETTVLHAHPPSWVHFCSWFLQSAIEGEIDPQLTIFYDEAWFPLQGYINTQNYHY
jgi:hypothetical protein